MYEMHQRPLWYTTPFTTPHSDWTIETVGALRILYTASSETVVIKSAEELMNWCIETDAQINKLIQSKHLEIVEEPHFQLKSKTTGDSVDYKFTRLWDAMQVKSRLDHPASSANPARGTK